MSSRAGTIIATIALVALADKALAQDGGDDLAAKTQNPISSLISVPFQNTFDYGADNGNAYILQPQPVIPHGITEDWNLIHRPIFQLARAPSSGFSSPPSITDPVPGDGSGTIWGLGDTNYSVFLSPAETDGLIWGAGASLQIPTATDDSLGSEKWAAGPTAVFLVQPKPWSLGVLLQQIWSFAGDSDRPDTNRLLMQPFVNYNLDDGWYLVSAPILVANWEANSDQRWTVPVGGGLGKIMTIWDQPINVRAEAYHNVEKPDTAPDGAIQLTLQFLFPR